MVALLRRGALAQQGQKEDVLTGQPEVVLPDGLLGGLDGLDRSSSWTGRKGFEAFLLKVSA